VSESVLRLPGDEGQSLLPLDRGDKYCECDKTN